MFSENTALDLPLDIRYVPLPCLEHLICKNLHIPHLLASVLALLILSKEEVQACREDH